MLASPGRVNRAHCGFGHENRVYLSCAGVVSVITVLLWQGMDGKIPGRRQFRHVTILQDYLKLQFVGYLALYPPGGIQRTKPDFRQEKPLIDEHIPLP